MGLFPRASVSGAGAYDDSYYRTGPVGWGGTAIEPDQILTLPAFYAGVSLISETIATVPLDMYQRVVMFGQKAKKPADNHPLDELLHERPNEYQTAVEWREMMTAIAILRDYAISEIRPGRRGPVDQLVPLHPDLVARRYLKDGTRLYVYRDPVKGERRLMDDEVFVLNSRLGKGLTQFARESVAANLAKQRYSGQLFSRSARPVGALTVQGMLNPTARKNLRKSLDDYAVSGQYSGKPLLLENGMTWTDIGMTADEAQAVEAQLFSIQDAARWLNLSPVKLGDLSHASYSNIEQIAIDFITTTMRPLAVRWEQAIKRDLILAPQVYFAEHNLEGLNRGDLLKRFQAYEIALRSRIRNRNEVRNLENLPPVADGNDFDTFPTTGANPVSHQTGTAAKLRLMVRDAAARAVRKETAFVAKAADGASVAAFYAAHAEDVERWVRIDADAAAGYCNEQLRAYGRTGHLADELDRIDALMALALGDYVVERSAA